MDNFNKTHKNFINFDKILFILNTFNFPLIVENVQITSSINFDKWNLFLKIDDYESEFEIERSKLQQIFRILIYFSPQKTAKIIKSEENPYNIIFSLFFNFKIMNFFYKIPVFLYEINLICYFYRVSTNNQRIFIKNSFCGSNFLLDFGYIKVKETRKYQIIIENSNPEAFSLYSLNITNLSKVSYEIEYFFDTSFDLNEDYNFSYYEKHKINKNSSVYFPTNSFISISLSVNSLKEENKSGLLEFFMNGVIYTSLIILI